MNLGDLTKFNRVIVAPLNWGLGHATRSMVIIDYLLSLNKKIAIASEGLSLDLLKSEYPSLEFFELPSYNINYNGLNFMASMIAQLPKIERAIKLEHHNTKKIVYDWKPDLIISDNRYGVFHKNTRSVLITHQTNPYFKNKVFRKLVSMLINRKIKKFNEVWIPDFENHLLSGSLSLRIYTKPEKIFIGPLGRFSFTQSEDHYDFLTILSGPEPHRSNLEILLSNLIPGKKNILVRGSNIRNKKIDPSPFIEVINLADRKNLERLIPKARYIICRSGYSSIMDLVAVKEKLILIPTPGQTEQEYLARHLNDTMNINYIEEGKLTKAYFENLV